MNFSLYAVCCLYKHFILCSRCPPGCWIVTGGFNLGIMKLTGEAVRDYTDAYGGNHMIAIGVTSWGCVSRNEVLADSSNEVSAKHLIEWGLFLSNTQPLNSIYFWEKTLKYVRCLEEKYKND